MARYCLRSVLWISLLAGSIEIPAQTGPDRQLILELMNRVGQLEQEVRQLRGDMEVYRHNQERLTRRSRSPDDDDEDDEEDRPPPPVSEPVRPREPAPTSSAPRSPSKYEFQQPSAPPPMAPGSTAAIAPPAIPALPSGPRSASEQGSYDTAYSYLRNGQYTQAIAGFQQFLSAYPNSALASNAQYWLGETYYVNRDYENAKQAFIDLGVKYPNSDKLPDALLKLGYVYDTQGDRVKAREVLQKLTEAYPSSKAAVLAKQRLQTLR